MKCFTSLKWHWEDHDLVLFLYWFRFGLQDFTTLVTTFSLLRHSFSFKISKQETKQHRNVWSRLSKSTSRISSWPSSFYARRTEPEDRDKKKNALVYILHCCCCGGCCCWYCGGLMQLLAAQGTKIVSWCVWKASYHGNNVTFLWRLKVTFSNDSVGAGCSCWCWGVGARSEMCCHVTHCSCFTWFGTKKAVWSLKETHISGEKKTWSLWQRSITLDTNKWIWIKFVE